MTLIVLNKTSCCQGTRLAGPGLCDVCKVTSVKFLIVTQAQYLHLGKICTWHMMVVTCLILSLIRQIPDASAELRAKHLNRVHDKQDWSIYSPVFLIAHQFITAIAK